MSRVVLAILVASFLLGGRAQAQSASAQSFNVQGILRTQAGDLQSTAVGLVVNLYTTQASTTPFYTQAFTTVPVENGFFSVELSGTTLLFDTPDAWVGIQVAGDAAEMPRQHITAVPYAFSAGNAAQLGGIDASGYQLPLAAQGSVSGTQTCAPGQALTGFDAKGTFSCAAPIVAWAHSTTSGIMGAAASPGVVYLTMDVPGAGYLDVTATVDLEAAAADATGCLIGAQLSLNTPHDPSTTQGAAGYIEIYTGAATVNGGLDGWRFPLTVQGTFPVAAAQTGAKIYLNVVPRAGYPCTKAQILFPTIRAEFHAGAPVGAITNCPSTGCS